MSICTLASWPSFLFINLHLTLLAFPGKELQKGKVLPS